MSTKKWFMGWWLVCSILLVPWAPAQETSGSPGQKETQLTIQVIRFADGGSSSILMSPAEVTDLLLGPLVSDGGIRVEVLDARQFEQMGPSAQGDIVLSGFYRLEEDKMSLHLTATLARTGRSIVREFSKDTAESIGLRLHGVVQSLIGSVSIHSIPSGATVIFDGERLDQRTPLTLSQVLVGKHLLTLELSGYQRVEKVLNVEGVSLEEIELRAVEPDATPIPPTQVPPTATAKIPRYGFIKVRSAIWGEIYIDGQPEGDTTRLEKIRLLTGVHEIRLQSPERGEKTVRIEVVEDETHVVAF